MKTRPSTTFAMGVLLACSFASAAFAQEAPVEMRKWDAATTIGILGSSGRDFVPRSDYGDSAAGFAWSVDAGRYLTTHLKTETGFMLTNHRSVYNSTFDSLGRNTGSSHGRVDAKSYSGALTYQFFENAFVHPFVSVGVRAMSLTEERETYSLGTDYRYTNPPVRSVHRSVQARPFVSAGFKSYFNERAFMKSELLLAGDRKGVSHGTLRVGVGFDF